MKLHVAVMAASSLLLAACGTKHNTLSGKPETCVPTTNAQHVMQTIVTDMTRTNYTVTYPKPGQIIAEKVAGKGVLGLTTNYQRSIFDVVPAPTCTRVIVDFNLVYKQGDKEQVESLNDGPPSRNAQAYLDDLYARYSKK